MSSRDLILGRVRAALADVPADEDTPIPRGYERSRTGPDIIELLIEARSLEASRDRRDRRGDARIRKTNG